MKSGVVKDNLGRHGVAILRTVHGGEWFDTKRSNASYRAALRLVDRRLLARDLSLGGARRFTSTPAGDALIEAHDDALERAVAA